MILEMAHGFLFEILQGWFGKFLFLLEVKFLWGVAVMNINDLSCREILGPEWIENMFSCM